MSIEIKVARPGVVLRKTTAEIPDYLKPPEMQCVNCWHRWKPEQHFRDTPRCPECGSTWLITVESINMALRKEHEH